jgi:hypothetical protein
LLAVLVGLYEEPERPQNAVDYIKRYMGAPTGIDVEALRAECDQLRKEKAALEESLRVANQKVLVNIYFIDVSNFQASFFLQLANDNP